MEDLGFDAGLVIVRSGKGHKDRATLLPAPLHDELRNHLRNVREWRETDLAEGYGEAPLPDALARKYPNAGREWGWQYLFPTDKVAVACRGPSSPREPPVGVLKSRALVRFAGDSCLPAHGAPADPASAEHGLAGILSTPAARFRLDAGVAAGYNSRFVCRPLFGASGLAPGGECAPRRDRTGRPWRWRLSRKAVSTSPSRWGRAAACCARGGDPDVPFTGRNGRAVDAQAGRTEPTQPVHTTSTDNRLELMPNGQNRGQTR